MHATDNQNHKFAQQFTQAVNEERKAEAGNCGDAHPPKYRLGGIGNVWAGIAHWQEIKQALRGE